ncbi:MAG: coenzyme F420-0:L-glutamate ligase [Candidatus Thorarchaeota archaeon]|nr:coenzyme F420-0:L-glutamate ligase [Candidatus Thorarchaeota archaeon]
MTSETYSLIPIKGIPPIAEGDNLPRIISSALQESIRPKAGDILVVTHKIVSLAEGAMYALDEVKVSDKARRIAHAIERDERLVEVALLEAVEIIRERPVLITRTKSGIITDMSGVDSSNAPPGHVIALPRDPDASARKISESIHETFGIHVPVLISDTQGRPWRRHAVNTCIGLYGMRPFTKNAGMTDLYGRTLKSSLVCVADEIAAAAELLMGQANEQIPVVLVRGIDYEVSTDSSLKDILRDPESDLFL